MLGCGQSVCPYTTYRISSEEFQNKARDGINQHINIYQPARESLFAEQIEKQEKDQKIAAGLDQLNGKAADVVFGTESAEWAWQDGGIISLSKGSNRISLHDLTGFEGRCDAIYLTKNLGAKAPEPTADFRRKALGIKRPQRAGKYDFVVVPNFQFGGMEHPGSILYNERTMFLGKSPTPDERLARMKLISHETAHLWFGDLVTMRWFDEVWTKEVFANHLAAKMVEPMFPGINHELSWLKGYLALAMDEERTEGATAIRQDLPNLADAGLIYNNMVYDKAPVMMRMLEEYIGPEAFHESLKAYLARYSYSNATWDDLVDVLDAHSDKDVKSFSESWVNERRGGDMMGTLKSFSDRSKYQDIEPETIREAKILLAKEDFLAGKTTAAEYLDMLLGALEAETNPLIASTIVSAIRTPLLDLEGDRSAPEARLLKMASSHALEPCRLQLKRLLASCGTSPAVTDAVYDIWAAEKDKGLTVNDYISFACQLAIRMPEKAEEIIGIQRSRLDGSDPSRSYNKNNLEHLDFVSRAALPDLETQDAVFEELLTPQGRVVEPWASEALGYLNHFLRESSSIKYIRPALDALLEVKATGDIFFPGNWCGALLGGHSSALALKELDSFLEDNPDYPQLLKNKILVAAYGLQRANNVKSLN